MKKLTRRFLTVLLAATMIALLIPFGVSATIGAINPDEVYDGWTDTPLLVIKINYVPTSGTPVYCATKDDTVWTKTLFDKTNPLSLWSFYDIASLGRFHFTPATENYANAANNNVVNDGIVEVTINYDHSNEVNITSSNDRGAAIKAAAEFVDFKAFDKDGSGAVEKGELAICFLCAGLEATRAGTSAKPSVHAFYTGNSISAPTEDGGSIGLVCGFVKFGEMCNSSQPNTVGTFCHELGHYLGTYDLYVNKTWGGANSPAGKVSVMAGHGSAGANSGEVTGARPSYLDAFHLYYLGFQSATEITDGEYTLYSRQSTKGDYRIYKIPTPNPEEYYLLENRYFDENNENFDSDTNFAGTRGIIIWHVDEGVLTRSGNLTANNGSEIAVAALQANPNNGTDGYRYPYNSGVFGQAGQVFHCTDYLFPGSMYWSTGIEAGQEGSYDLKIEILNDASHEMKIKVTGSAISVKIPDVKNVYSAGANNVTVIGQINDLLGQTLNSVTISLSANADMSDAKTVVVNPDDTGKYMSDFTGLTEKVTYYTKVVLNLKEGDLPYSNSIVTKAKNTDPDRYTISFFRGLTSPDKAYAQKVNVGEAVTIRFPMVRDGYVFGGWYLDSILTQRFDLSVGKTDNDNISLYARWIEAENAVTIKVVGATLFNATTVANGVMSEPLPEPAVVPESGKVFAGWFADEALTVPFDFEAEQAAGEVTLYAKFVSESEETTTSTQPTETTASSGETTVASGETTSKTDVGEPKENSNIGLIVGIVVAVLAVAAVAIVLVMKKKKK